MKFTDTAEMAGTRRTADGYLVADAFAVRVGVQVYRGSEVGLVDRETVRVYRPEDEVRDPESMKTFSHVAITLDHPSEPVTPDNWADLAKGEASTEATWDGNKIKLPLIIKDADAIKAIEGGKRELSAGYTCKLDWSAGVTTDGDAYDAIQREIRINHLAIVKRGRAGAECRIGDGAIAMWGASPFNDRKDVNMTDQVKTRTVLVDGLSVVTTDAGAQALEKLNKTIADGVKALTDSAKALSDAEAAHAVVVAAKDKEIAKAEAARDEAQGKILSDTDLDKRVADRASLIGKARAIVADIKTDGLSDAAIRKATVVAKLGDGMADKSEAYLDARFDILTEDAAKADPVADVLNDGTKPTSSLSVADQAYNDNVSHLEGAYRQKKGA
ncbi:MAG: DUF2213 domain-containing protein [Rhodobacteraceae bacterium]|nr:DUF2213 domain-containing protein [Paracoccaceae bacterium]